MTSAASIVLASDRPLLDVRIKAFDAFRMNHPKLKALQKKIEAELGVCPKNSIFLVFGPSGSGKSTLREAVERNLKQRMADVLEKDPDCHALISVEAQSPENGIFNWKQHFINILESTGEPLIDLREDRRVITFPAAGRITPRTGEYRTIPAYQASVEKAILGRRPAAVFVDEAQNFCKIGSQRRLIDQLDVVKSIANISKTPHVLVGTYDLLHFRLLNGQVARRCIEFHLERYRADVKEEAVQFQNVIRTFASKMPFPRPPELEVHWEYLYERSLGCVGVLKDWLTRAIGHALYRGADTVHIEDLEAEHKSINEIKKLFEECMEGELRLQEKESDRVQLRRQMGLDLPISTDTEKKGGTNAACSKSSTGPKRVPFTRNPKRDLTGRGNDGNAEPDL